MSFREHVSLLNVHVRIPPSESKELICTLASLRQKYDIYLDYKKETA